MSKTIQPGWKMLRDTTLEERSWPEDFAHENGNYYSECLGCGRQFLGYKRRHVCRVCAAPTEAHDAVVNVIEAARGHSCNYKIGHPSVKTPCAICIALSALGALEKPHA